MEEMYRKIAKTMLESYRDYLTGDLLAEFLCCKGMPGLAEETGGQVCSGDDGIALAKAAEALGYEAGSFAAVNVAHMAPSDLRCVVESIDPVVVVSLDVVAREVLSCALKVSPPPYGRCIWAAGRRFVAVDAFEQSLASDKTKRVSWYQLKAATRGNWRYWTQ